MLLTLIPVPAVFFSALHWFKKSMDGVEHGQADTIDDSILGKGNRRKKRLGDCCVFCGSTNEPGDICVKAHHSKRCSKNQVSI